MWDFSFAEGLSIETSLLGQGSLRSMESVVSQLNYDYCVDVRIVSSDNYGFTINLPEKYKDTCKAEWILEVLDYHKCMGVEIKVIYTKS